MITHLVNHQGVWVFLTFVCKKNVLKVQKLYSRPYTTTVMIDEGGDATEGPVIFSDRANDVK